MPSSTVGWVIARGTVGFGVWEFESGRFSLFCLFFLFLSFSSQGYRFSVRLRFRVRVKVRF